MRTFLTTLTVSVIFLSSCRQTRVSPSINVERLANAYAELLVLNERYNLSKDSLTTQQYVSAYEGILRSYDLTKDEYVAQFKTALASPGLYRQLCDKSLAKLQTMRPQPGTTGR